MNRVKQTNINTDKMDSKDQKVRLTLPLIGTIILITWMSGFFIRRLSFQNTGVMPNQEKNNNDNFQKTTISKSPSGQYLLRFTEKLGLELVSPNEKITLIDEPIKDSGTDFTDKNVTWDKDESSLALTYVANTKKPADKTAILLIFSNSGNLIKKVDLGKGAYYGINQDIAFPPVASLNGKYIAVQTDLIHKISIFAFLGNRVKDLPTKYANVKLFSNDMYRLEDGKYSPFLDYKWTETGDGVLYRF